MLRVFVLVLIVANLGFYAWSRGGMDDLVGISAAGDRDPARASQQVNPQAVRVANTTKVKASANAIAAPDSPSASNGSNVGSNVGSNGTAPASTPAGETSNGPAPVGATTNAASAAAPASATASSVASAVTLAQAAGASSAPNSECLEAGPYNPTELISAETVLVRAALPPGSWTDIKTDKPGTWIVYMGRYPEPEVLERKEAEVGRLRIPFERLRNYPDLQPGLSLGRFDSREAADAALQKMNDRGLKTARVIAVAPPQTTHMLRVERGDTALRARLTALKSPALGAGFVRCGAQGAASAPAR